MNAIDSAELARKRRRDSIVPSINSCQAEIDSQAEKGGHSARYQVEFKENIQFVITAMEARGYKVSRPFFHRAYNELLIKW